VTKFLGGFGWSSIILKPFLTNPRIEFTATFLLPPGDPFSGIPTTHLTAQGEALGMNFQIMQMDLVALVQNQGVVMFVAFVCWQEPETRAGSQRINDGAQPQRIKSILVREKKTQLTCLQCKAL